MALRLRRGTDAERLLITPVEGELIYTTDTKLLFAGDGSTAGGNLVAGGGGFYTSLDSLTDTDLSGAQNNEVIAFNSGTNKWEPAVVPGISGFALNDIADVFIDTGALAQGDVLVRDGAGNFSNTPKSELFNDVANIAVSIVGDVTGDVTGNVTGTLSGNSSGIHSGPVVGDVVGSLFSDASNVVVDGLTGSIFTSEITATNDLTLETSDTGEVRAASSNIRILSQTTGAASENGPAFASDTSRGTLEAPIAVNNSDAILSVLATAYTGSTYQTKGLITFNISDNTVGAETKPGRLDIALLDDDGTYDNAFARLESNGIFTVRAIQTPGISTTDKTGLLAKVSGGIGLQGTIVYDTTLSGLSYYHDTDGWNNVLTGNKPVETTSFIKPGVYADDAARDTAIPTPTAGMMVFNSTGTKFQGYTGSAWVDLN